MRPAREADGFTAVVQILNRKHYVLESKATLGPGPWIALSTNSGNGALRLLGDPNGDPLREWYRLRVPLP